MLCSKPTFLHKTIVPNLFLALFVFLSTESAFFWKNRHVTSAATKCTPFFVILCPLLRNIRLFWKIITICQPLQNVRQYLGSEYRHIISAVMKYLKEYHLFSTVVTIFCLKSITSSNCFSHDLSVNWNVNSFRRKSL